MIQRMVSSAVIAGLVVGLLAAVLHFAFLQGPILEAERYETGALVHFAPGGAGQEHQAVGGAGGDVTSKTTGTAATEPAVTASDPGQDTGGKAGRVTVRNALTVFFKIGMQIAFALLLVAGFSVAEAYGRRITARDGLLWGIAGFAAFQLAPAMGLAPELPGTMAAALEARQLWWVSVVAATGVALALLGYGRGPAAWGAALILLAAPHLIGAPELDSYSGVTPPELSAAFAARTLGCGLIAWAALGWLAGHLWSGKTG